MEKYTKLIDRILAALEETAALTENTWDDTAASAARAVFEKLLLKPPVRGTEWADAHHSAMGTAALPSWILPLVVELAAQLLRLLADRKGGK